MKGDATRVLERPVCTGREKVGIDLAKENVGKSRDEATSSN